MINLAIPENMSVAHVSLLLAVPLLFVTTVLGCSKTRLEVEDVVFGKYIKIDGNRYEVITARSFGPGDTYGWVATIKPYSGRVKFREVYEIPSPMTHIDKPAGAQKFSISDDGKMITIEGEVEPGLNILGNATWTIEQGDPTGLYTMTLSVNDKEVQRFTYSVDTAVR